MMFRAALLFPRHRYRYLYHGRQRSWLRTCVPPADAPKVWVYYGMSMNLLAMAFGPALGAFLVGTDRVFSGLFLVEFRDCPS